MHYLLMAIYRDLSEVEDDENEGLARLGKINFIGRCKNIHVKMMEHLCLPALPRSASKM